MNDLPTSAKRWVNPHRCSYWQIGCDDGKAGRPAKNPEGNALYNGYWQGYKFGRVKAGDLIDLRCPKCEAHIHSFVEFEPERKA